MRLLVVIFVVFPVVIHAGSCPGVCQTNTLPCSGGYRSGLCAGSSSVQCCVESTPNCNSGAQCQQNSLPCNGTYKSGLCPGSSSIQCCVYSSSTGGSCSSKTLFSIGSTPVKQLQGDTAFYWTSGYQVDCDGAPNAYDKNNSGIDYLQNAGSPGNWYGIATDSSGQPYVQGVPPATYAPYPGYYVSTTSLENPSYGVYDCRRYANSVAINFYVLPGSSNIKTTGVKLGDLAFVYWTKTQKGVYAQYGDVGPSNQIGEGSVALQEALGNRPYASNGKAENGISSGVYTLVFPGSGNGKILTQSQINSMGASAFNAWGGMSRFQKCIL